MKTSMNRSPKENEEPTSSQLMMMSPNKETGKVNCSTCHLFVTKRYFTNHLRSKLHKNNLLMVHSSLTNVSVVETAFGHRIITYRIVDNQTCKTDFKTLSYF